MLQDIDLCHISGCSIIGPYCSGYRNWGDFEHPLLRILPNIRKYACSVRFVVRSALDGSEAND
jgi:hypothetical protein